ncbi:MAG: hypothetical protein E7388_05395, partial [Ruminococcaceae bacterium]|nr:hypothetical protein [Oscillospiraceae bacterium]
MKHVFGRVAKSCVAIVLVLCMMTGICPVSFATTVDNEDDGIINYVSLGASNTNGYGLDGYLPEGTTAANKNNANVYGYKRVPEGSYPDLVRDYLVDKGYTVNLDQLAISSMRVEELRVLLDNSYYGDEYTKWRFTAGHNWFNQAEPGGLDALRDVYQDSIANADLITVDIGVNNFGVYVSNQLTGGMFGNDVNNIDPEIAAKYEEAKLYIKELIAEHASEYAANIVEMEDMVDTMAYALVGFCVNFEVVMEKIYELNPDANVVVVSIQNLMSGLKITVPGIEEPLPFGEIFGSLVNTANLYVAVGSSYSDRYMYADVRKDGRVEFFLDDILNYDGNPATLSKDMKDCFDLYDDNLMASDRIEALANEYIQGEFVDLLMPYADVLSMVYGTTDAGKLLEKFLADGASGFTYASAILNAHPEGAGFLQMFNYAYGEYLKLVNSDEFKALKAMALEIAYDVLAEIMREGAGLDTLELASINADFGAVEDALLDGIFGTVVAAVEMVVANPGYSFAMEDVYPEGFFKTLAMQYNIPEGLLYTVASLGVRTSIGNSFYGHPNRVGHVQLKDAIVNAIENDITGKDVALNELIIAAGQLKELLIKYGPVALEALYNYGVEEGYIDPQEVAYWTGRLEAWKEAWNSAETDEEKLQVCKDIAWELYQAAVKKGLIDDEAVQNTIDEVKAIVNEIISALEEIKETLENIDVAEIKLQLLNNLKSMLEDMASEIDPEVIAEIESVIETIKNLSKEDVEAFVEAYLANQTTKLFELVYYATNGEYAITGNDYYVAIGGNTVSGIGVSRNEATYTELLQDTL